MDALNIHAYKHNGKIYHAWDKAIVLEENDEFLVLANDKSKVTEEDGRVWYTKEPAIIFFSKKNWFNIIAQVKKTGIFYYCNILTPYIIDNDTVKYIDYDLDLRVFPNKSYKVLDKKEYEKHKLEFNYSDDIDKIVNYELKKLIELLENNDFPFENKWINMYYEKYLKEIEKKG